MVGNINNLETVYNEMPNTFIVDGVRIDNYKKCEEHFTHGWRDVVIPTINNYQRLGSEWIVLNDVITKEVIDLTDEEIRDKTIPKQIPRMKFIIQVFLTTGIKYEDIVLFIQNLAFDESQKYVILTRLRSATHFERYSNDLLTISQMMGITSEQLDNIFINGNLIE